MKKSQERLTRRNFLIAVTAGGAASAAVAAKLATSPAPSSPSADKRRGKGYQDTAHVRNYYRTTEV